MATSFPTGLDVLTNPTSADSLASPDHAAQHANVNDAVEAIEAQIGTTASPVLARLASPTFTGTVTAPIVVGTLIGSAADTDSLRISGGYPDNVVVGGNIFLYGNSHATRVADVAIQSNGTEVITVDGATLRVGIGVLSPTTALDVSGTVTATSYTGGLASAVTAVTQTAGNNTTAVATTAFVTSAVGTVTTATRELIGGGSVTITPVANTMTSGSVSWGTTLSASPKVGVTANSSSSAVSHTAWTSESTTGVTVWILRSNTVATRVDAIGIVS